MLYFEFNDKKHNELLDYLLDYGIATEEEVSLVCNIHGMNLESLEDILYVRTGYRSLSQLQDEE